MNNDSERTWKEEVVAYREARCPNMPRETEENHEKLMFLCTGLGSDGAEIGRIK